LVNIISILYLLANSSALLASSIKELPYKKLLGFTTKNCFFIFLINFISLFCNFYKHYSYSFIAYALILLYFHIKKEKFHGSSDKQYNYPYFVLLSFQFPPIFLHLLMSISLQFLNQQVLHRSEEPRV